MASAVSLGRQPEAIRGGGSMAPAGPVGVEVHTPAEEVAGVEASHHDVCVGHRGGLSAEAVARRAGFGSGRSQVRPSAGHRSPMEAMEPPPAPMVVTSRIGSASGSPNSTSNSPEKLQLSVDDHAHIGAGPAHVQRDRLGGVHGAGEVGRRRSSPRARPESTISTGFAVGVGDRHLAAVGPQEAVPAAHLECVQFPDEVGGAKLLTIGLT